MTGSGFQLTVRDRAILAWIGRHGIVTPSQVGRRFFSRPSGELGMRATYRRLAKLHFRGFILRDPTAHRDMPHVVRLTPAGARISDSEVAPARLVEAELRHSLSLVDLMELLAVDHPEATIRTERELRTDRRSERMMGNRQLGRGRMPDGELTLSSGKVVAVELDLTSKRTVDCERIIDAYRHERFDFVWWYVVPGAVARVRGLVATGNVDDFIEVRSWLGSAGRSEFPERWS